jgi:hypothetical protein
MSRYVICTNSAVGGNAGANAEERNAITDHLKAKGWQVWHWFEDVWLTVDELDESSPRELREELRSLIDERTFILIMAVEPVAFSGFGSKQGWTWMRGNWGRSE